MIELRHGINLGGYLSQCDHTYEHYDTFIGREDITNIRKMGFDHVRLPVDCNAIEHEDGTPHVQGLSYIDKTLDWCKEEGLNVIIDLHKAYGYDFNAAGSGDGDSDLPGNTLFDIKELQDRFVALWEKIAARYGTYDFVAFELLNEVVEQENAGKWNELIRRACEAIRKHAKTNTIIYGGICWNSISSIKLLEKPIDDNILFTFHFYEPLIFTHQKAHWVKAMDPNEEVLYPADIPYYIEKSEKLGFQGSGIMDTKSEVMGVEFLEEMISEGIKAAEDLGVKLYCGEFGVIDKAPAMDTLNWFQDVLDMFERRNISWCIWCYKGMDFSFISAPNITPVRDEILRYIS